MEQTLLVTGMHEIFQKAQIYVIHLYGLSHQLYIQFISDRVQHNRDLTLQCSFHERDGALVKSLRCLLLS